MPMIPCLSLMQAGQGTLTLGVARAQHLEGGRILMVMPDWGGAEKLVNPKRLASQVRVLTAALGRSEGQLHSGYVRARR